MRNITELQEIIYFPIIGSFMNMKIWHQYTFVKGCFINIVPEAVLLCFAVAN